MNESTDSANTSRRGGPRNGSGRPPKPYEERKIVVAMRLTPRAAEHLRYNRQAIQKELERASRQQNTRNQFNLPNPLGL